MYNSSVIAVPQSNMSALFFLSLSFYPSIHICLPFHFDPSILPLFSLYPSTFISILPLLSLSFHFYLQLSPTLSLSLSLSPPISIPLSFHFYLSILPLLSLYPSTFIFPLYPSLSLLLLSLYPSTFIILSFHFFHFVYSIFLFFFFLYIFLDGYLGLPPYLLLFQSCYLRTCLHE